MEKIIFIHSASGIANEEKFLLQMANVLSKAGYNVCFIENQFTKSSTALNAIGDTISVHVIQNSASKSCWGRLQSIWAYLQMMYLIISASKNSKCMYVLDVLPALVPLLKSTGKRVIYCGNFIEASHSRLIYKYVQELCVTRADAVIVGSETVKRKFQNAFPNVCKTIIKVINPLVTESCVNVVSLVDTVPKSSVSPKKSVSFEMKPQEYEYIPEKAGQSLEEVPEEDEEDKVTNNDEDIGKNVSISQEVASNLVKPSQNLVNSETDQENQPNTAREVEETNYNNDDSEEIMKAKNSTKEQENASEIAASNAVFVEKQGISKSNETETDFVKQEINFTENNTLTETKIETPNCSKQVEASQSQNINTTNTANQQTISAEIIPAFAPNGDATKEFEFRSETPLLSKNKILTKETEAFAMAERETEEQNVSVDSATDVCNLEF